MDEEWGHGFSVSFPIKVNDLVDVERDATELTLDFTTANWQILPEFTNLKRLCVSLKGDEMMAAVAALPSLVELQLYLKNASLAIPPSLTHLNIEAASIPNMEVFRELPNLTHLGIRRCKAVSDFSDLASLRNLRVLELGIVVWEHQAIDSINFLSELAELESLALLFDKFIPKGLGPLYGLPRLRRLHMGNKLSVEMFAEAAAKMPKVECWWFHPYHDLGECPKCGTGQTAMFSGKGQGTACKSCDADKVAAKVAAFEALKASA